MLYRGPCRIDSDQEWAFWPGSHSQLIYDQATSDEAFQLIGVFKYRLNKKKRILLVSTLPAGTLAMLYFVVALFPAGTRSENLFSPLPLILQLIAVWSFPTSFILDFINKIGDRPTSGPALECLSMTMLFMPTIILGVWVSLKLFDSVTWSIVPGILVGAILANVISTPFRSFVLDLEWLPSNPRYKV